MDRKSTTLTKRDEQPRKRSLPGTSNGMMKAFVGVVHAVNADPIGTVLRIAMVPSNALLYTLKAFSDGALAGDVGLYKTVEDGGAPVNVSLFGTAVALADGDDLYEDLDDPDDAERMLWERLGLDKDPGCHYDICVTLTTAAAANRKAGLKGTYVQ